MIEERLLNRDGLRRELELMNESELAEIQSAATSYLGTMIKLLSFGAIASYTNDAKTLLETINEVKRKQ